MKKYPVSIVRYEKPLESVRKAVSLCNGFEVIPTGARVFIKPNIVYWTRTTRFPKWGVITTSRVVQDTVRLLKDRGIDHITIGEGTVLMDPADRDSIDHAFETLGFGVLKKRYAVRIVNIFERPFRKVDLGHGVVLSFNCDILDSDWVINLPVLKTHAQTIVSLGIKNLKGTIDLSSRKKCHSQKNGIDLHFRIAKLPDRMPPIFTLIDGIYTNERGPSFDGRIRRSNILIASADILSADMVGARVLGYDPAVVPHLVHAAENLNRRLDLSDIKLLGEPIEAVADYHDHSFPYNESNTLPAPMEKMGIKGLSYRKYDLTLCTYCSLLNGAVLSAIAKAWKDQPLNSVEVLTGKTMEPTAGMKYTILLGRCMYIKNKNHPNINQMIAVKGCPPSPQAIISAFHQAGICIDGAILKNLDLYPGTFMKRYENRPEFDESFFTISG
ncbi:MAG: DUF362 domain-containing protein [Deltaproteobacteria bacterium]|nr:DUF362 domain-containing protein [Deltaproteobacteria bacterium]MBW2153351.1 DUF362 domain-containing protein [Deltaproteobacteria bacterium]